MQWKTPFFWEGGPFLIPPFQSVFFWVPNEHNPAWSMATAPHTFLYLQGDLVAAGILSGNRNFEGRVHPNTRANYLASPPLVIAYAIAGTVRIDFDTEPIGECPRTNGVNCQWFCSFSI